MKIKRATLEVIAPSVEEAIQKGLGDLGLPEEAVEVEVLDEGTRGLFGIGSRHARVRLTVKAASGEPVIEATSQPQPEPAAPAQRESTSLEEAEPFEGSQASVAGTETPDEEEDYPVAAARGTVSELLERMKVRARVSARYGEADDEKSRVPILVEVRGNDLSILIGRHAETLNALQYITNMIVSKELGQPVSVIVDVEGYRARREGQIRQLANRMAEQAIKTGRRQVLEPMPANERRIIHIELRDHPQVRTESIGEEPRRKVTIIPKT